MGAWLGLALADRASCCLVLEGMRRRDYRPASLICGQQRTLSASHMAMHARHGVKRHQQSHLQPACSKRPLQPCSECVKWHVRVVQSDLHGSVSCKTLTLASYVLLSDCLLAVGISVTKLLSDVGN